MTTLNARILARRDTVANWNSHLSFIPLKGEIIIYTDAGHTDDGQDVPNIKIGDGNAYLIDLPFVGADRTNYILQQLGEHTGNSSIHVSQADRTFWNNKLNCSIDGEVLIFNTN